MHSSDGAVFGLIAALTFATPAGAQPPVYSWTGFYVGAGVGWDHLRADGRYTLVENSTEIFSFEFDRGGDGVQGQFFGGWGMNWGPWYGSAELAFGISSASARVQRSFTAGDFYDTDIKLRQDFSIVPSIRAGYLLAPEWLLYARFGWAFAHTRLSYAAFEIESVPIAIGATRQSRWLHGPRVGLGVEYAILPNVRLRADWTFTWYDRISLTDTTILPPTPDIDVNHVTVKPRQSLLLFGIVFGF